MKCALVTGASRGIGRAVSIQLGAMGYHVLVNYKQNEDEASVTRQQITDHGGSAELLPFDVADKQSVDAALDAWLEKNKDKKIIVLVNNAGIREDLLMMWMQEEQWNKVINTNLNSFFYVTQKLLIPMMANKFGRIINMVSLSGLKGLPGQTNYSASKAGLIGATRALAQEVARKGVTVNAVAPGFIATDMTKGLPEGDLKAMIPMQRFGTAEEVADLVGFLASEKSNYITGQVISINGGLY